MSSTTYRRSMSFGIAVSAVIACGAFSGASLYAQSGATGGFLDSSTGAGLRSQLSGAEIQTFLPDRGRFRFPSPYNTEGARLTNASDCGGQDCVKSIGYSYWSNINNHTGSNKMLIFVGLERRLGGGGPTLYSYNKSSGQVRNEGALFPADSPHSWSTGEGWYFSGSQSSKLYMNDGPRMLRFDVLSHTFETVFDVTAKFGGDKYVWQMHSSYDDRVHSFTLRQNGTWEMLGCVAYFQDTGEARFFAKKGDYDECQVDKSGQWLVIKEDVDGANAEDNRIIDLRSGNERVLLDPNGAAGHSDSGYGYLVAEDNFNAQPGAVRVWDFNLDVRGGQPVASVQGQGTLVYQLSSWESGLGHVAHGNSRPGTSLSQQMACASNANRKNLPRVNEIVCFRLDGSLSALVVAPNLTDLNASGGGSEDYWKLPKGNLDVTGEYFVWTGNAGTGRLDAFIVHVPIDKLGSVPSPTPSPSPSPTPTPAPAPTPTPTPTAQAEAVKWTSLVNVTANGNSLQKTSGCGGCPDAGAASQQSILSGDGYVEFAASENDTLRFIGLSPGNTGTAPASIAVALRLQGGRAEVREGGVYRSEVAISAGDILRIAVGGGAVKYSKNGAVFYTSSAQPAYPLLINTALLDLGATIVNVMIGKTGTALSATSTSSTSTPTTAAPTPTNVWPSSHRPRGLP